MRVYELGQRNRRGIKTMRGGLATYEQCDEHGKVWVEGDLFEQNGGKACEECVSKAKPT